MDFEIRKLKMGLISYLDKVELPAEVKRMVVKEVYEDAERKAEASIRQMLDKEELKKQISDAAPVCLYGAAQECEEGKQDE